jgi:hypothetical protein
MILKPYIPSAPSVIREGFIVLGGVLIAAFILSRFPALQNFVRASSITVDDKSGNNLF